MKSKVEYPKVIYMDEGSVTDQGFLLFPDEDSMQEYMDSTCEDVVLAVYKFAGYERMTRKIEVKFEPVK